jgi:hypothetical protein
MSKTSSVRGIIARAFECSDCPNFVPYDAPFQSTTSTFIRHKEPDRSGPDDQYVYYG